MYFVQMLNFWVPRRWFEIMERAVRQDCWSSSSRLLCCLSCNYFRGKSTPEMLLKLVLQVFF